jgi:hypothetical protein
MIVINDHYADGRDMSWLWDVDFTGLIHSGVSVVSGIRAYDMATRLQYDEVLLKYVDPNIPTALKKFIQGPGQAPKVIFCTYTAMLALRRDLKKYTAMERVL